MAEPHATLEQQTSDTWTHFQEVIHPQVLASPRIDWDRVQRKLMSYVITAAAGTPWVNYLALVLAVQTCHARLGWKSVGNTLSSLHCRFRTIFQAYALTDFAQWDPEIYLPRYLNDRELADSPYIRQQFVTLYTAASGHLQRYLHSLPADERPLYQAWALPPLPPGMSRQLRREKEVKMDQALRRKAESDAVTPHFARIRGEAHVRWNEFYRLRQKFRELVAFVQSGEAGLPVSFSYEEQRRGVRLHFILWDRPSFVMAHADRYHEETVRKARTKRASFVPERNHHFLEFTGAERLDDASAHRDPEGMLWFGDLLRYEVLGRYTHGGTAEEVRRKQVYLRSWGYGTEDGEEESCPFDPGQPGLLIGGHANGISDFMNEAQRRTGGLLLLVESLFAAATFGLACLDFFTTTGARIMWNKRSRATSPQNPEDIIVPGA